MPIEIESLSATIERCPLRERRGYRKRLSALRQRVREGKPVDRALPELCAAVEASAARMEARRQSLPEPRFPDELPVSSRRKEIAEAIRRHQVVVIAGETGSGKTTQIPKICLSLGRGVTGMIGHTQPRRIAARSVAARISEELQRPLGETVGYKVRFTDKVSDSTCIKLLTDGMLLAEIQGDRHLEQYDTIIIDEAHERSLNIDFLLGYLKGLLPRRPDLKLIITSATINTEGFSRFFDQAPVIEVSGRTYPVEVRYRPILDEDEDERDRDQPAAIVAAVEELSALDPLGDILVFLPGEREIRESAEELRKHRLRETEIIPLYSRLSAGEQDRVFQNHTGRRIVLATNVAETSLTVPGIRFVIDPGYARISRYSPRTKVQRLPVEAISQASADQRAGRCGRVAEGVCIRLYAEEDYLARARYTEPEILRTNLASVILQMAALGLGEVDSFPFMDPPDGRFIADGFKLLQELGAMDEGRRLTEIGRKLARFPVDPRLGRMLLAADSEGSLEEVTIIAAALAVQEPRERPLEAQQAADVAHEAWVDERSDFLAYLKLWAFWHEQARHLSQSKLRKLCRERFLSYVRMREWHEVHGQLLALTTEMGLRRNGTPADYGAIHRAILAGLLGNIAFKAETEEKGRRGEGGYLGARGIRLTLFPGSALARKQPKWVMAAELVETSRLFARTCASILPEWVERVGAHLVKRSWFEPHWEKQPAQVAAYEQLSLYGLVIVARRRVHYGPIDPSLAREIFIRHALVLGEYRTNAPFFSHNLKLLGEVEELEAKARRRDVLVDEHTLYSFYDRRLPEGIHNGKAFERWRAEAERADPKLLFFRLEELMQHEAEGVTEERFPGEIVAGNLRLPLSYHFEPGSPDDGVTVTLPVEVLASLSPFRFEWLVPGMVEEKVIALIKSLPKSIRRNFVPVADFSGAACRSLNAEDRPLIPALAHELKRMTGVEIPGDAWRPEEIPPHLRMNFRVVDGEGRVLGSGRDLPLLQRQLAAEARAQLEAHPLLDLQREGIIRWDFGELPEQVEVKGRGMTLTGYPGLVDTGKDVALRLFEQKGLAAEATRKGVARLFFLEAHEKVKHLKKLISNALCLPYASVGPCEELKEDFAFAVVSLVFVEGHPTPRNEADFHARLEGGRPRLLDEGNRVVARVAEALNEFHEVARRVKGEVPPLRLHITTEIREQIERLIYPGFITATPAQWLPHLARYLKAARLRLEKFDRNAERDRQLAAEVGTLWRRYLERAEAQGAAGRADPAMEEFRWMLEELRVSLFAQELKTALPVSVPRLEKRWREIIQP